MTETQYKCTRCSAALDYRTTKHVGCPECGTIPAHSAD